MNKKNVIITIVSVLILTCLLAFARTTTTDLGLIKPTWDETYDILADVNANSDILEAFANDVLEFDLSPVLRANLDIATFNIEGVDATELGYVDGVTSDIQTQFGLRYLKTEMDSFSELQAIISDKTLVNEEDVFTIDANWVNTTNPWADNEVADDITIDLATLATTITVTDNEDTAENNPICFVAGADPDGGSLGIETDGTCYYTPSTGKITTTGFVGALTGNADTVTSFTPASGSLTLSGADALTITTTNTTNVTLPTSGTLTQNTLANLSSVAINAALLLGTSDAHALGSATKMWADLFLASGAVINFNNGNVTLTHSANVLTLGGGALALGANNLTMTGSLGTTGARVTKVWTAALESTADITINGTALASTYAVLGANSDITQLTGLTTALGAAYGGTGVLNNAASTLTISGNFATTITVTEATGVTLPASGTLTTLAGTETFTNKTLTTPIINHNVTTSATTNTLTVAETGLILVSDTHTETLPTAVGNSGLIYIIKKTDADTDLITVDGDGTETIDGSLTYADLNYQYSYVIMISDNSNWQIIGESTVRGGTF